MGENRIELDTFSTVTALPQTPIQHWHRDDGFLFSDITQSTPLSRTIERDRLINYVTQGGKLKLDHEGVYIHPIKHLFYVNALFYPIMDIACRN